MNIFFDVDYTILGLDNSLRPDTKETFQALLDEEHKIYIWSGMGERWEVFKRSVDQEMQRIYRIVNDFKTTGTSEDKQYRKKGSTVPLF